MIPAVILAAGKSTRMGSAKALLEFGEDTFLTRIIKTLQEADVAEVIVVVGHSAERIGESLESRRLPSRVVLNPEYEAGQLSSILTGLRAIDRPGVTAMLLTLVDVPLVSADTVRKLVARYRAVQPPIVRPTNADRHGHPLIVDRSLFNLFRSADPVNGIKPIVRAYASDVGDVAVDDEGAFIDIDTPEDYRRVHELLRRS